MINDVSIAGVNTSSDLSTLSALEQGNLLLLHNIREARTGKCRYFLFYHDQWNLFMCIDLVINEKVGEDNVCIIN